MPENVWLIGYAATVRRRHCSREVCSTCATGCAGGAGGACCACCACCALGAGGAGIVCAGSAGCTGGVVGAGSAGCALGAGCAVGRCCLALPRTVESRFITSSDWMRWRAVVWRRVVARLVACVVVKVVPVIASVCLSVVRVSRVVCVPGVIALLVARSELQLAPRTIYRKHSFVFQPLLPLSRSDPCEGSTTGVHVCCVCLALALRESDKVG